MLSLLLKHKQEFGLILALNKHFSTKSLLTHLFWQLKAVSSCERAHFIQSVETVFVKPKKGRVGIKM